MQWFCSDCSLVDKAILASIIKNKSKCLNWFCESCELAALSAVSVDRDIEERCSIYLESVTNRIVQLENLAPLKADKVALDACETKMNVVINQVSEAFEDISRLSNKMELMRNEAAETERRKNNIIIRGLPEDSDLTNDQLATEILNAINVEPNFSKTERLGAKRSDGKPRPLRIRLGSSNLKDQAVKNAARIRRVIGARQKFYQDRIEEAGKDPRRRWSVIHDVLHATSEKEVMSEDECRRMSHVFAEYFVDKVRKVKCAITDRVSRLFGVGQDPLYSDRQHIGAEYCEITHQQSTK